jgi:hypothetical protein
MAAPESTKFQINYKLHDGTLINLYASTIAELETGLADLSMNASNIRLTGAELSGGSVAPAAPVVAPTVATIAQQFNATPVVAAATGADPVCRHGAMTLRTGTSARGPWKGWMCAAPKGAMDKCDTIWVR